MAKIDLPKQSGKLSKVREKSVKSQVILKTILSGNPALSKRPKIGFQDQVLLNAGQKYWQNAPRGAFCNTLTFIKLPFVIKLSLLSIFEWPFYTGFTVL